MTLVLLVGLVAGVVLGLRRQGPVAVPPWLPHLAQATLGAAAGASVDGQVIRTLGKDPLLTVGGVLATLMVTLAVGQLLRLGPGVSQQTATFASIAGGAAGVSLMAQEYGADEATVLSVQYLRVLAVIVSVPMIAPLLGNDPGGSPARNAESSGSTYVFAATIGIGLLLSRLAPVPAGTMLFPLLLASCVASSGWLPDAAVPAWLLIVAYLVVGLVVGTALTHERLLGLAALLPLAAAQTALGIVMCAGIGVAFAAAAHISLVDGYLATTPGGLPAVTAMALQIGDEVGLILAMQFLRLFLALLIAAMLGARYSRAGRRNRVSNPRPAPAPEPTRPLAHRASSGHASPKVLRIDPTAQDQLARAARRSSTTKTLSAHTFVSRGHRRVPPPGGGPPAWESPTLAASADHVFRMPATRPAADNARGARSHRLTQADPGGGGRRRRRPTGPVGLLRATTRRVINGCASSSRTPESPQATSKAPGIWAGPAAACLVEDQFHQRHSLRSAVDVLAQRLCLKAGHRIGHGTSEETRGTRGRQRT